MIEHLKSGLSISTHFGCGLKCSYCILSTMNGFNNGPVLEIEPKDLIYQLLNECDFYCKNETPIMINNRTDPFLPSVEPYTLEILDLLIENNISSPIIIISKFPPPTSLKKYFQFLDICYFYSYSGIETDFNFSKLKIDLEKIKYVVPKNSRFHYFRPIIPGLNDDFEYMKEILLKFRENEFTSSVIAGFRITNLNKHLIKDDTINVNKLNYSHKLVNNNIYEINKFLINDSYCIFRHTSCAIANHLKKFNKLNYFSKSGHCFLSCPNYKNCFMKQIDLKRILEQLEKNFDVKYKFKITDNKIEIISPCTQELTAYIKNAYGCNIIADRVGLSKSEEVILNEK